MSEQLFEKIAGKIESCRDQMAELQKALIPIKAISPLNGGTGEIKKAKFLEPILKEVFDEIKWVNAPHPEAEDGVRPNILCTLGGRGNPKTLWFMAHMDVVPEGDKSLWNTDPFEATVKDGRIYGRGAEDNHQGLISSLFAIKTFKDEGITPPCKLGLLLVSDEETGSNYGLKYILEKYPDLFKETDQFIVPDSGDSTGQLIEIAEKGIARFRLTVIGKQAHSAFPNRGINASRVLSYFITRLDGLKKDYNKENQLFDLPFCTMEPTQRPSNDVSVNTVPGKEIQIIDCRIIPDYNFGEFVERFKKLAKETANEFGAEIKVEPLVTDMPSFTPPEKTPIIATLKDAIKKVYNVEACPQGKSAGTVGRFLRYQGLKAVVWGRLNEKAHMPNEFCSISNMVGDAKVFARVIQNS